MCDKMEDWSLHTFDVDLVPFEINNSWIVLDIHSFILNTQASQFYSTFHGKFEEWGAFFLAKFLL